MLITCYWTYTAVIDLCKWKQNYKFSFTSQQASISTNRIYYIIIYLNRPTFQYKLILSPIYTSLVSQQTIFYPFCILFQLHSQLAGKWDEAHNWRTKCRLGPKTKWHRWSGSCSKVRTRRIMRRGSTGSEAQQTVQGVDCEGMDCIHIHYCGVSLPTVKRQITVGIGPVLIQSS